MAEHYIMTETKDFIVLIYSPDDCGWYAEKDNQTSKKIYKTKELLEKAIMQNKVKWEN